MPELAGLLAAAADALNVTNGILRDKLDIVRTRAAPSDWHDVRVDTKTFSAEAAQPDKPVWEYKNERDYPISLRRIEVLFNDKPDADYQPVVAMASDGTRFMASTGDAFKDQDLALDLYGGRPLQPGKSVEIFIWAKKAASDKTVTISAQFGEL